MRIDVFTLFPHWFDWFRTQRHVANAIALGHALDTIDYRDTTPLKGGRVEQSNFHDYPVLRMSAMPRVDVHIVESTETPRGAGEPAVPPIAPAVANAVAVALGRPVRALPITVG